MTEGVHAVLALLLDAGQEGWELGSQALWSSDGGVGGGAVKEQTINHHQSFTSAAGQMVCGWEGTMRAATLVSRATAQVSRCQLVSEL